MRQRKAHGYPHFSDRPSVYWNKTTFDEVGCEIPTDEASLLAAGAAFLEYDKEYYPFAMNEYDRMIFMVYYLESKYGKDWVTDGTLNYSEEEIKEGLAFINKLEDEHVIPTVATISGDMADSLDKNSKWIDGNYAGLMEWDSAVSKVKEAMEGSEHPKEAAMLVNFLLNEPEGAEICSTERGIPCSQAAIKLLNEKNLGDTMTKEANAKVLGYSQFTQDPQFDNSELKASPDGLYYKIFGRLSSREITPEEGAKTLSNGITAILEEN